jgi:hypothetical protein
MKKGIIATYIANKGDKVTQLSFLENLQKGFMTPCDRRKNKTAWGYKNMGRKGWNLASECNG